MTDELRDAILDELIALDGSEPRQAGDFTVRDYAERAGVTPEGARYRLTRLVSAGLLSTHEVHDADGRRILVYRKLANNADTTA